MANSANNLLGNRAAVAVVAAVLFAFSSSCCFGQLESVVRIRVRAGDSDNVGSGAVISHANGESTVLTCHHLVNGVSGTPQATVELFGKDAIQRIPARLVASDEHNDLALFRFSGGENVPSIPVAKAGYVIKDGDEIRTIGCHMADAPTVRWHTVKKINPFTNVENVLYSDSPSDGRSGGPVLNKGGEIIGVHQIYSPEDNMSGCSPIGPVAKFVKTAAQKSFTSYSRTKTQLVLFTANWCAPCKAFKVDYGSDAGAIRTTLSGLVEVNTIEWVGVDKRFNPPATIWSSPAVVAEFKTATGQEMNSVPTFWVRGSKTFLNEYRPGDIGRAQKLYNYVQSAVSSLATVEEPKIAPPAPIESPEKPAEPPAEKPIEKPEEKPEAPKEEKPQPTADASSEKLDKLVSLVSTGLTIAGYTAKTGGAGLAVGAAAWAVSAFMKRRKRKWQIPDVEPELPVSDGKYNQVAVENLQERLGKVQSQLSDCESKRAKMMAETKYQVVPDETPIRQMFRAMDLVAADGPSAVHVIEKLKGVYKLVKSGEGTA